ncbi:MAG: PD-(D/E)XK nuclease family protein [Bacteroidales bacterium]|nr:PD-(D/E)XK nuclease family protein [Bacteroidales bacterium]
MDNIKTLLQKVQHLIALDKQRKEEARKRGEKYNIFSVLGLETSEVQTHSAFLASLLNPDGNHGVGSAFLDAFVREMNLEDLQLDTTNSQVKVEHVTGDGRIDILIFDNNKKAIIVENKIYAGDQPEQLKRYDDYAKQQFTNGYRLLYLTLDGHKPSKDSTKDLKDNQYLRLAYNNDLNIVNKDSLDNNIIGRDVLHWLEECVQIAYNKPLVRETIIQYQSLIKALTGMNSENETKQEIIKLFSTKENYETAALIANNFQNIKKRIVYQELKPQLEEKIVLLNNELFNKKTLSIKQFEYGEGNYSAIIISVSSWKSGEIYYEFDQYNGSQALVYGVNDISEHKMLSDVSLPGFKHNAGWVAYKNFPYYWWDIDTINDIFSGKVAKAFMNSIKELLDINERMGNIL